MAAAWSQFLKFKLNSALKANVSGVFVQVLLPFVPTLLSKQSHISSALSCWLQRITFKISR